MSTRLEQLLNKSRNNTHENSLSSALENKDNLIDFTYNEQLYHIAIKKNILVFSEDMMLLYTVERDELAVTDNEFLQEVNKVVVANSNQKVSLYINRANSVERITFTSIFDATFIFRKLTRLANRNSEGIESLVIEKDAQVVRKYVNEKASFLKSNNCDTAEVENRATRSAKKTDYIATLARVEDFVEEMIGNNVREDGIRHNETDLKKCVELLNSLIDGNY